MTEIDVSYKNISDLTGIANFPNLTYLRCDFNQLTALDVSGNAELSSLDCHGNLLTTLDIHGCPALWSLDCSAN